MTWFSDRLAWMVDKLADTAGEAVTLSRASSSTSITATAVKSEDDVSGGDKVAASNYWERDWLVKKADYTVDGVAVVPQSGDRITDSNSDVWELMLGGRRPELVQHAGGYAWVVKTKRITAG
jgi:hypothetical protein